MISRPIGVYRLNVPRRPNHLPWGHILSVEGHDLVDWVLKDAAGFW
jgi:hypothetical protein